MTTAFPSHVGALLESVQTDVRILAEAQVALIERMDRAEARLDRLEHRMERVELHVAALDARLDRLEHRMERVELHVAALDARLATTQGWIERIARHLGLDDTPRPRTLRRRPAGKRRPPS